MESVTSGLFSGRKFRVLGIGVVSGEEGLYTFEMW